MYVCIYIYICVCVCTSFVYIFICSLLILLAEPDMFGTFRLAYSDLSDVPCHVCREGNQDFGVAARGMLYTMVC